MSSTDHAYRRGAAAVVLMLAFVALLAVPHQARIRHPTIYGDDVARIGDLQARPLSELWFRPFNEHMAPFFETVSWATWQAAGRQLTRAPLAFTVASYLPFVLCLGLLAGWIRHETGSRTTALVATLLFGLSPLYAEAVYWYSASSFTWALCWTMIVLLCAGATGGAWPRIARSGLFLGSLLAPACSAIGLLTGPLGSLRLAAGGRDRQRRCGWSTVVLPTTGTLLYLGVCSAFRYDQVIRSGMDRGSDIVRGVLLALRAPTAWLLPGTFGFHNADLWLPPALNLVLTGLGVLAVIAWGARSPQRGLIAAALGLILGGYLLTYPFRHQHAEHWLFQNERFHLFPQLGLVLLLALAARRWLSRFDRQRLAGLGVATALGVLLLGVQLGRFNSAERTYSFPEQRQTLAVLERLGHLCRAGHVSQAQCIAALPPMWSHWFQFSYNGLWMVPAPGEVSGPLRPDLEVQRLLLGQLSPAERRALWGGMDVSRYSKPTRDLVGADPDCVAIGQLVETDHTYSIPVPLGMGMRQYQMRGWPANVDFELTPAESSKGAGAGPPRFLCLPCGPSTAPLEIWWTQRAEDWSPLRSVRFRPNPGELPREWALPLDQMPHWDPADAGRIRIRFMAAPIAIGTPRLLR